MKSPSHLFLLLYLLSLVLIAFSSQFTPLTGTPRDSKTKLLVCRSIHDKKPFLTVKRLDKKSTEYKCKKVSSKRFRQALKISPEQMKTIVKDHHAKKVKPHKVEVKNSILYVNILRKYLDNYICYQFHKKFVKAKCLRKKNRCKAIFKRNNFQIYSTVDLINIFKKLTQTAQKHKELKQYRYSVLILKASMEDLHLAHFIFDKLHQKFRIFNEFDVVLFKTNNRLFLFKFSAKKYKIQLSSAKLPKQSLKFVKGKKRKEMKKKLKSLRTKIKRAHKTTKNNLFVDKLGFLKNEGKACKVYNKVFKFYSGRTDRKENLVYYFDPLIDIQFGEKYIRAHYLNRLLTFRIKRKVEKSDLLAKLNTKNIGKTYSQYINGFALKNTTKKFKAKNKKKKSAKRGKKKSKSSKISKKKKKIIQKKNTTQTMNTSLDNIVILPDDPKTKVNSKKNSFSPLNSNMKSDGINLNGIKEFKNQNQTNLNQFPDLLDMNKETKYNNKMMSESTSNMKTDTSKLKMGMDQTGEKSSKRVQFTKKIDPELFGFNYEDKLNKQLMPGKNMKNMFEQDGMQGKFDERFSKGKKNVSGMSKEVQQFESFSTPASSGKPNNEKPHGNNNIIKSKNQPPIHKPREFKMKHHNTTTFDKFPDLLNLDNKNKNNQIFLELEQVFVSHFDDSTAGFKHVDDEQNALQRIIYRNKTYVDREDFLSATLAYKVKPKPKKKKTNLNEKKFIKLYQPEQDYYESKFNTLDDTNIKFSDIRNKGSSK